MVIKSFKHKGLKNLFEDDDRSGINPKHAEKLLDILDTLDSAYKIEDMRYPGSNLHKLQGNRQECWSVKVSGNWRVTFSFEDGEASDVNYEDYH
jgi:proteic killer suppression protein